MLTTNKIKVKERPIDSKYLEEEKDEKGELTGNVISDIPRRVITTSQEKVKNRPARVLPHNFTDLRTVSQKNPERTFIQTADLEDMRSKARMSKAREEKARLDAAKKVEKKKRKKRSKK